MGKIGSMGQRKHLMFLELLLTTGALCVFCAYRGIDPLPSFVTLMTGAFGFAMGANAAEHFAKRGGPPPAP